MIGALDFEVFKMLNGLAGRSDFLDWIFIALAEYGVFAIAIIVFLYAFLKKKNLAAGMKEFFYLAAGAIIGRLAIVPLIRAFFFRPRPFLQEGVLQLVPHDPLEGAFPSGHATVMFALATAIFMKDKRLGSFCFIIGILSGAARVIAGVHYPLDIVGGIFVGVAATSLAKRFFFGIIVK